MKTAATSRVEQDARRTYDALAPAYDTLTSDYDHRGWILAIERLARRHGLRGRSVLDVACGTGKSFAPLVERGYEVAACDISPAMVARATVRGGGDIDVHIADMRDLPRLGRFDLALCLDDSLNHLLDEQALTDALTSVASNLRQGGLFVFDVSLLATYRTLFASDWVVSSEDWFIAWHGEAPSDLPAGQHASAAIDVFARGRHRSWRRTTTRLVQRHFPASTVTRLLRSAGLRQLSCYGQQTGIRLSASVHEQRDTKALFVATPY